MTPEAIKKFAKALAIVTTVVGGAGSISCVPFAFTSYVQLLGVAGIYFCAGAILIVGGQIAYALLLKTE